MHDNSVKCLFDSWQRLSAPMFHTSEFWPVFTEDTIGDFLKGTNEQPVAKRQINKAAAFAARGKIEVFLASIEPLSDGEYACKPAYLAFEQERLTTIDLILNIEDAQRVQLCNDQLFGKLSDLHQTEVLAYLKDYIQKIEPQVAVVETARARLLDFWSDVSASRRIADRFLLYERYTKQLKPLILSRVGFIENLLVNYDNELSSQGVCMVLEEAIATMLGDAQTGWSAHVRDGAPNAFIDYHQRVVVVPANRHYSKDRVKALAAHEVGVHVVRSMGGESSREPLAAYGMAGYGPAEEALGALVGSVFKQHSPYINQLICFAIIDFGTRRGAVSFRAVYELTQALLLCISSSDKAAIEERMSGRGAFGSVVRMMRLGTGVVVERSTTKYWRGTLLLSQYFQRHGVSQAVLSEFLLGKYDCLSGEQLQLIKTHTRVAPVAKR